MAGRFEYDRRRSDMLGSEEILGKPDNLNPQLPDEHIKECRLGKNQTIKEKDEDKS